MLHAVSPSLTPTWRATMPIRFPWFHPWKLRRLGFGRWIVLSKDCVGWKEIPSHMLNVWPCMFYLHLIYLQNWVVLGVNVGKYVPTLSIWALDSCDWYGLWIYNRGGFFLMVDKLVNLHHRNMDCMGSGETFHKIKATLWQNLDPNQGRFVPFDYESNRHPLKRTWKMANMSIWMFPKTGIPQNHLF